MRTRRSSMIDIELVSREPRGGRSDVADRPPLLLVHGACGGAWQFEEHWLDAAALRGYPSHAMSLRGHGGSGGASSLRWATLRDYAQDVRATLSRLPGTPVLIGYAMGGLVARQVAQDRGLRAVVLVCPTPEVGAARFGWQQFRRSPLAMGRGIFSGKPRPVADTKIQLAMAVFVGVSVTS